jgi:hypothetical protein
MFAWRAGEVGLTPACRITACRMALTTSLLLVIVSQW